MECEGGSGTVGSFWLGCCLGGMFCCVLIDLLSLLDTLRWRGSR